MFSSVWGEAKLDLLQQQTGQTMAFFNLSVSVKEGKTQINHYIDSVVVAAPDCAKTRALQSKKDDLTAATSTCQLTDTWMPASSRDVSGFQPLSCAAFLDFTAEQPTANMPEVVQDFQDQQY